MRIGAALVAAVAFAVYAGTLGHGFVWDDPFLILAQEGLRDWSRLGENLAGDFWRGSGDAIGYWRPVVTLSYMVDRTLWSDAPFGFHLQNVLLHAVASLLVLQIALRLPLSAAAALGAALLFAVHPVHSESVAWIAGRTDLWCAVFLFAALALDLEGARRGGAGWRAGALAATALALLSKEMAAVIPALVLLRGLLLGVGSARSRVRGSLLEALPYAAIVAVYAGLRFGLLDVATRDAAAPAREVLFWTWWSALVEYLRVLALPHPLTATLQLGLERGPLSARVLFGLSAAAALGAVTWRSRRAAPALTWGIAALGIALLPLTNFVVPISTPQSVDFAWSERFLYIPSLGLCVAVAWGLVDGLPRWLSGERRVRLPAAYLVPLALLLVAGAARTWVRAEDWRDDLALFRSAVRVSPDSTQAHMNLGAALERIDLEREAARHYRRALELHPDYFKAHYNLGNQHWRRGEIDAAEDRFRRALAQNPDYAAASLNLGLVMAGRGRLDEAAARIDHALALQPGWDKAVEARAYIRRLRGVEPSTAR